MLHKSLDLAKAGCRGQSSCSRGGHHALGLHFCCSKEECQFLGNVSVQPVHGLLECVVNNITPVDGSAHCSHIYLCPS